MLSESPEPRQHHAANEPNPAAQLRAELGQLLAAPARAPRRENLGHLTIPQLDERLEAQLQLVALDVLCDAHLRGIPDDEAVAIAGGFIISLRGEFAALIAAAEKDPTP